MAIDPHAPARFPSLVADLPLTRRALGFAAEQHEGQVREADHTTFILHPLEVAKLLRGRQYRDEVVAAAALHDIVEDTGVDPAELEYRFGAEVARLVGSVTEPSGEGSYAERKTRLREAVAHADNDALTIYAADKLAKSRELRMSAARATTGQPDREKLCHFWASLELLPQQSG